MHAVDSWLVRRAALATAPLLAFVAVLALGAATSSATRWDILDPSIRALKVVALFGCLVGGLSFPPHARMFRAWMLFAATYALLVLRDAVLHRSVWLDVDAPATRWIEAVMVTLANGLGTLGAWIMARTWYVGGIALPGTTASRGILRAIAIGVAVAITLPSLWLHASDLIGEPGPRPLMGLVNAAGDATSLSLIAPVLLTALALRGAPVGWAWGLLTCSMAGWLCYDATFTISDSVPGHGEALRVVSEGFRALAATAAAAAGIAQATLPTATRVA